MGFSRLFFFSLSHVRTNTTAAPQAKKVAAQQIHASESRRAEGPAAHFWPAPPKVATQYRIAGPGMATVVSRGELQHRVHFPFAEADRSAFAFSPGTGAVRQLPQKSVRRRILRGGY